MNVYVESNFVLEHALEQEQCESCEELIRLASAGSIRLLVPAFSLAEPHIALARKGKARSRLIEELENCLSELGRSRPFREALDKFSDSQRSWAAVRNARARDYSARLTKCSM